MKKQILSFSLLSLITALIFTTGTGFTKPHFLNKKSDKKVEWKDTIHDFGDVQIGPELVYTFTFKNKTSKPVTIKSAEPGCSCTVSEFTQGPIKKGGKGTVTAKYNTAGRMGFFKKFIKVTFEDGTVQELIITGNVIYK